MELKLLFLYKNFIRVKKNFFSFFFKKDFSPKISYSLYVIQEIERLIDEKTEYSTTLAISHF